ncbi:MAG: hypothetical protein KGL02_08080, partial [Acidobacteriota bacterium]|nr:hypothetical protein [Acidobacteriota bacterium]
PINSTDPLRGLKPGGRTVFTGVSTGRMLWGKFRKAGHSLSRIGAEVSLNFDCFGNDPEDSN